jgi:hypothetical protein
LRHYRSRSMQEHASEIFVAAFAVVSTILCKRFLFV